MTDLCDESCVRRNDLQIWVMTGENRNPNKLNTAIQLPSAFRYDAERLSHAPSQSISQDGNKAGTECLQSCAN